ncbi:MAG: cation:proton antiporter [Kofleriaceae bacterium]
MTGHDLIQTLALVVGTAAVVTVVFQRLRLPVVLGYLAAGMLVGPHTSVPFFADEGIVAILAELGVILLMFSIGMELSVRGVIGVGVGAVAATVLEVGTMVAAGAAVGSGFGLDGRASLFVGAMVGISSTTIISRTLDEQQPPAAQRRRVFGLLVVEDLLAILLFTVLTAVSRGAGLGVGALLETLAKLAGFLAATIIAGMLVVPRLIRATVALGRHETTLVSVIGLCFALAMLAHGAGYSVALGAFLAGALVAEGGVNHAIEPLIEPVRDLFAAIFFVSVGMLIDPAAIASSWLEIVVILAVVVVGKVVAVSTGVFLAGHGVRAAVTTGMTMAQIGELSFVAASIGVTSGALPARWYAVAVAVSAVTTALTPPMARLGPRVAAGLEARLPRRLATFAALYGSWIERARSGPRDVGPLRRSTRRLAIDGLVLFALVLGAGLARRPIVAALGDRLALDPRWAALALLGVVVVATVPLLLGMARLSRAIAAGIADRALPVVGAGLDLGAAPRRMLVMALQVPVLLVALVPALAAAGAFAPWVAVGVVAASVAFEAWRVWRGAGELDAHVRAGAEAIVEVLAAAGKRVAGQRPSEAAADLSSIDAVLPGLGAPTAVRVTAASALAGQTLAATNLRGATGATVLAIQRGDTSIPVPAATDTIEVDDVLALAGSTDAVAAARALLAPPPVVTPAPA